MTNYEPDHDWAPDIGWFAFLLCWFVIVFCLVLAGLLWWIA